MSLNTVTRRQHVRVWPSIAVAVVAVGLVAGLLVHLEGRHPTTARPDGAAAPSSAPFTPEVMTAGLLDPHRAPAGFLHARSALVGALPITTGCYQLDDVLAARDPNRISVTRVLAIGKAALVEQIDAGTPGRMSDDFSAMVAALATCSRFDVALPRGRLVVRVRRADVPVAGTSTIGYRLEGTLLGHRIQGFLGLADLSPASTLELVYLHPLHTKPATTTAVFQDAIRRGVRTLGP